VIYLVDTHLLLRAAAAPDRLSEEAREILEDSETGVLFSAAAIGEVAIKASKKRPGFAVDPHMLRRSLLDNGYGELAVSSEHAAAVGDLPALHGDLFDRIQVAQARSEGLVFLTADLALADYGFPVQLV
jgi:PIN domain nuclease of toxin-antitoxin system